MPTSKHQQAHERARTLETLCDVWTHNRDDAMAKAVEYARAARDAHDEKLLKQAQWQRELAEMFDDRLKRDRAKLASLRYRP